MTSFRKRPAGFTLIEMVFFGAIAALVLVGVIGILTRGSHFLEVARRSSGSQSDLRGLLETLTDDCEELVALADGATYEGGDTTFKFYTKSTRVEAGLNVPAAASLRQIEYKLGAAVSGTKMRECQRTVSILTAGIGGAVGESATRTISRGISRIKITPVAAIALPDKRYNLVAATDAKAKAAGATVACLVVDVTVGESDGKSADQSSVTSVVTKLWCRNRIMEISRGGLQ